jgi:CheY-like chemotaxis protein
MPSYFLVLVVDPDAASASEWKEAAARAGLDRLYLAASSAEAIEYILKVRGSPSLSLPAVVLVDGGEGIDALSSLVEWLRPKGALAWVVPIALVPPERSEAVERFYESGARSCLPRPSTLREKVQTLAEVRHFWEALNVRPDKL